MKILFIIFLAFINGITNGQNQLAQSTPKKSTDVGKKANQSLVPAGWNPKLAGDQVLKRLITVTASQVEWQYLAHGNTGCNRANYVW